ncbi:MAG TPA: hypothetical protein VK001_12760, partial [Geminicoccaceae bacterium]|nr:hypothetical protein [Geminicoccaceae bacterium]
GQLDGIIAGEKAMARINFTSLKCVRKQDVVGKDEAEIWIDDEKKWDGVFKKGETAVLIPLYAEFDKTVKVQVKERNPNNTKTLGTKTIYAGQPDPQPVHFKTSGAHYELTYSLS